MSDPKLTDLTDAELISLARKACNPTQREYLHVRFITMEIVRRFDPKKKPTTKPKVAKKPTKTKASSPKQ